MQESSLREILRSFKEGECEFILVGGLAAVLNGAPIQTYDVDLLYSQHPRNLERLMAVLSSLDAVFRIQPERRLRPKLSHLAGTGHLNLLTPSGPLDLLATLGRDLRYDDLLPHSLDMDVGRGIRVPVLDLETLIALKEELAGAKDIATLPILRQTLNEMKKKKSGA